MNDNFGDFSGGLQSPGAFGDFSPNAPAPAMTARQRSLQTILSLTPQDQRQQLLNAYGKDPELAQVTQNYNVNTPVDKGFQDTQNFGDQVTNYAESGGIGKTGYDMLVKPTMDAANNFAQKQSQINVQHQGDPFGAVGAGLGNFVGGIAQAGYQASPLASGVRLFGGLANQTTQALGINQGETANPLLGNTQSFSNQVRDQGFVPTLANVGMDVLNSAGGGDSHISGDAPGVSAAVRQDLRTATGNLKSASDNIISRYHNSVLGSESGIFNGDAPFNGPDLRTAEGLNTELHDIQRQLDSLPSRMKTEQANIENTPGINSARKQVLLQQKGQEFNAEGNSLKQDQAAHIQTLHDMGQNHIPEASIPQGVPGLPEAPKGAAYAGPNSYVLNPTLGQKVAGVAKQVAEPFMNPNPEPMSLMGILRDQRGFIGQPRDFLGKFGEGKADPLASLKQEALKYKNADEFVDTDKAIKVPIANFKNTDTQGWNEAVNNVSKGELSRTSGPVEVVMTPDGYKLVEGNHRAVQALNAGDTTISARVISKEGLDKIAERDGPHIKIGTQDVYTRQQLTDLYNQAHASKSKSPLDYLKSESGHLNLDAEFGKEPVKTQSEVIADGLGLEKKDRVPTKTTPEPISDRGDIATRAAKASDKATADAIASQRNAPTPYDGFKDVKTWQDVRDMGATGARLTRDNVGSLVSLANEILGKKADTERLFRFHDSIEHPESLVKNAKVLKTTPEKLKTLIDAFKKTTDFQHSLRSGVGESVGYRDNYALHPWDLSDKAAQKAMNDIVQSKGGAFKGQAGKDRVFESLREGRRTQYTDANGILKNFELKKQSVGSSISAWGNQEAKAVQAGALKKAIMKIDPQGFKDFGDKGQPFDANGKGYKVSGIPGLSGWMSPEAYHATQGFRVIDTETVGHAMARILKITDITNRLGKGIELLGGAFHDLNTSLRYTLQELASSFNAPMNNPLRAVHSAVNSWDMTRAFWDEGHHATIVRKLNSQGWSELMAKTHLTGTQATDSTVFNAIKSGNIEHLNPYSEALFSRKIDLMKKLTLVEEAKGMGIKDPRTATPEQIARLSGASDAVNARYGGINLQTINRNPIVQYIFRQIGLAPDFMEGKIKTDTYAASALDPRQISAVNNALPSKLQKGKSEFGAQTAHGQSSLALRQVIGTTLGIGLLAELSRQAMGKGSNKNSDGSNASPSQVAQHVWQNDVKDPSVALPFKNKQNQAIVGKLPATDVSELTRAFTDPGHYATARLSAGLSIGSEMLSGKDYFGNTLTDTNVNPNPTFGTNLAAALKSKLTIPGMQAMNANNPNSTTNLPVALTNIAGLRVARDPNDPDYQKTQEYVQARTTAMKGLTPNQTTQFNALFPTKRDNQGNYLPDSKFDAFSSAVTASILLKSAGGDGVVLNRVQQMNQAQSVYDPMWDVNDKIGTGTINDKSYPALNVFLKYQQLKADDPASIAAKEIAFNNPWVTQLEKDRGAYFKTLPLTKNPDGLNPIKYPEIAQTTQDLMDQEKTITDPKEKSIFINAHPELTAAYQKIGDYINQRQGQVMAPQFAQAPVASPDVQAAMNARNFNAPGVQQYMNQMAAFKIAGPYGDGIGGAGGGRNTSQLAIDNVSQGLQANGKLSPYAQNSARNKAAAMQRSIKNNMRYANKSARRNLQQSQQGHGASLALVSHFKPNAAPKGKGLVAALKGIGRKTA